MKAVFRLLRKFFIDLVPDRETEPGFLRGVKFFFMYSIYIGCLGYIIYLSREIVTENPHIEITSETKLEVPSPCNKIIETVDCDKYFEQPESASPFARYWSTLDEKNKPQIYFSPEKYFGMYVEIFANATPNANADSGALDKSSIIVTFADAASEEVDFSNAKPDTAVARTEQIISENKYVLSPKQRHMFWFRRIQKQDLDGHKWRNRAGVQKKTNDYFQITSRLQTVNPQKPDEFAPYATIDIHYQSRILETNEQKKDKTVLALLSTLGGAYGLGIAVYCFCFGASPLGPWGWAQELPGIRRALKRKLRQYFTDHIPLVHTAKTGSEDPETLRHVELVERVYGLERRSALLELLLKEYVVDIGDLEDLAKSKNDIDLEKS
ncbi:hypothetical protein G9A89_012600 [Geosiphon pyriformis]|nr:hypothetical protein G9A89_012600 [Geosiphon pyriformis]